MRRGHANCIDNAELGEIANLSTVDLNNQCAPRIGIINVLETWAAMHQVLSPAEGSPLPTVGELFGTPSQDPHHKHGSNYSLSSALVYIYHKSIFEASTRQNRSLHNIFVLSICSFWFHNLPYVNAADKRPCDSLGSLARWWSLGKFQPGNENNESAVIILLPKTIESAYKNHI
jgi:hypothetical protein